MNDREFEVMDQLYFVTSFEDLMVLTDLPELILFETLEGLITREWVKCYEGPDNEVSVSVKVLKANYSKYQYLATKQGLLVHNKR